MKQKFQLFGNLHLFDLFSKMATNRILKTTETRCGHPMHYSKTSRLDYCTSLEQIYKEHHYKSSTWICNWKVDCNKSNGIHKQFICRNQNTKTS